MRDKLFFFVNYEQEYIPQTRRSQTRRVLTDRSRSRASSAIRRPPASSAPPICCRSPRRTASRRRWIRRIAALLARQRRRDVRRAVAQHANNLRTQELDWLEPQKQINYYPTARLDYQITPNLSWMGSWNLYSQDNEGRRIWPLPDYPLQDTFKRVVVDHVDRR